MSSWYREYFKILEDDSEPYQRLNDAGEYYQPGDTEIWYLKKGANINNFSIDNLYRTHGMIGTLQETDPETILSMMQAESWDPENLSLDMLNDLGVDHASMTTGDVIVTEKKSFLITQDGFTEV